MTASRILVIAVGLFTVCRVMGDGTALRAAGPREIEVIARRFAFEPAEIEVSVNAPVRLLVRSADGVHGIEIKQVKVRREIPRGDKPITIDFTPKEAGRFPILCSEYCGDEHDSMRGVLIVAAATEPVE